MVKVKHEPRRAADVAIPDRSEVEHLLHDPTVATTPEAEAAMAPVKAWQAERNDRATGLRRNARALVRASDGWDTVTTEEEWSAVAEVAHDQYAAGGFFLERLGAARHLDPTLMAVLVHLRQRLIAESGA